MTPKVEKIYVLVIFALLDPNPEYGSESTGPIEYGSNTDPDPQVIM
jgi:hypothetical protein